MLVHLLKESLKATNGRGRFVLKGQGAASHRHRNRFGLASCLGSLPISPFSWPSDSRRGTRGLAAALTATSGGLAAVWFFIPPRFSLAVNDVSQLVGLVTYGMVSLTFVAFGQVMNQAHKLPRNWLKAYV